MTRALLRALNAPILIILITLGLAIQSALFSSWPLNYIQPDFVLLAVIWCSMRRGFDEGGVITLILANIAEIHSAAPQGLYLISYMVIYLIVRVASHALVIPTLSSYAALTLYCSMGHKILQLIILYLLGASPQFWQYTLTFLLFGAAIEGLFSIWVYQWLEKFDWITFKNAKAKRAIDEDVELDSEGF